MIKTIALIILLLSCTPGFAEGIGSTVLTGKDAYLGQAPPGNTPEPFAPGIVSTKDAIEFAGTFSPDGREYYYTSRAPGEFNRLLYTEYREGGWTTPAPPSFAIPFGEFEPSVTSDGSQLFFASARPLPGSTAYNMTPDIWVVTRDGSTWGTPQHFGDRMFYMTFTSDGVMYSYANDGDRQNGYVCRRPLQHGVYANPENLADTYPFFKNAHHPCVARDESYLVFDADSREPDSGGLDLFVSFKSSDGSWTEPVSLGNRINTPYNDMAASLSPDGQYLFYSTWAGEKSDILWVSTEVIDELRPGQ